MVIKSTRYGYLPSGGSNLPISDYFGADVAKIWGLLDGNQDWYDPEDLIDLNEEVNYRAARVNVMAYGNGTTGVDDTEAIQQAINEVVEGGDVVFPGGRTYRLKQAITNVVGGTPKSFRILGTGAVIEVDGNFRGFDFRGNFSTPTAVSSISESVVDSDDRTVLTTLTVSEAPSDWKRGDIIKLVADDEIPGARPGSGSVASRVGQFGVVWDSVGTTVSFRGKLRDPFTTNIRVAKLIPTTVEILGSPTLTRSDASIEAHHTPNLISFQGIFRGKIEAVIERCNSAAVQTLSCWNTSTNLDVSWINDDPTASRFGYGIIDASSSGNTHYINARRIRHAYTDDTYRINPGTASLYSYGRTSDAKVSGIADSCYSTAWDTHGASENINFTDITATNCGSGLGLRGRNHRFSNVNLIDCYVPLQVFDEDIGNESYGHEGDNLSIVGYSSRAINVDIRPVGHPNAGIRDSRTALRLGSNVRISKGTGVPVYVSNATVDLGSLKIRAGTSLSSTSMALIYNSSVRGSRWEADFSEVASGSNYRIWGVDTATASILEIDGCRVIGGSGYLSHFMTNGASAVVRVKDVLSDVAPSTAPFNGFAVGGYFDWKSLTGKVSSQYISMTHGEITSTSAIRMMTRTLEPSIYIEMAPSSDITMGKLESAQLRGQTLTLFNRSSSANVTILNGFSTGLTRLVGGVDRVLSPGDSIQLFYANTDGGVWVQHP